MFFLWIIFCFYLGVLKAFHNKENILPLLIHLNATNELDALVKNWYLTKESILHDLRNLWSRNVDIETLLMFIPFDKYNMHKQTYTWINNKEGRYHKKRSTIERLAKMLSNTPGMFVFLCCLLVWLMEISNTIWLSKAIFPWDGSLHVEVIKASFKDALLSFERKDCSRMNG